MVHEISDKTINIYINAIIGELLLNEKLGITLTDLIQNMRVERARNWLVYTSKSVTKIAYDCGSSTLRTFNRVFLKITDMTPTEYRKM